MKTLTMRELNRSTARVLDAVASGESFELRRNGKTIGYLSRTAPPQDRKPDWKAHFDWLRKQPKNEKLIQEFDDERRRLVEREKAMGGH